MADEYDARDAIALIAEELGDGTTPRQFTFNGVGYPCAPGELDASKSLSEGGFSPEVDLVLVVDLNKLPATPPGEQDTITYQGNGLRVVSVQTAPDTAFIVMGCADDSRGV